MRVAAEILEHLLRAAELFLRVHHPLYVPRAVRIPNERAGVGSEFGRSMVW